MSVEKPVAVQCRLCCMSRVCFVCRGSLHEAGDQETPLGFSCIWSFYSRVRSAFGDAEKTISTERSRFLLQYADSQNNSNCTHVWRRHGTSSGCCDVVVSGRTVSPPPSPAPEPSTGPKGSTSSCSTVSVTAEHLPEETRGDFHDKQECIPVGCVPTSGHTPLLVKPPPPRSHTPPCGPTPTLVTHPLPVKR